MYNLMIIVCGIFIMSIGGIGNPSDLDESPNTATLVFLSGMIILIIGVFGITN